MWDTIAAISEKLFTEAGLVAGLLFTYAIYLTFDNRTWRRENKDLHEKLYNLGLKQSEANMEVNGVLDKIADLIGAISRKLKMEE